MQKGFNSDISVRGIGYHVQTEDWGFENPYIVSRVFKSGAVLKTFKTSYSDFLKAGPKSDQDAIVLALKNQHSQILDLLLSGQLL